jgi:hypothetical protein
VPPARILNNPPPTSRSGDGPLLAGCGYPRSAVCWQSCRSHGGQQLGVNVQPIRLIPAADHGRLWAGPFEVAIETDTVRAAVQQIGAKTLAEIREWRATLSAGNAQQAGSPPAGTRVPAIAESTPPWKRSTSCSRRPACKPVFARLASPRWIATAVAMSSC